MKMKSITPGEIATRDLHQFLLGSVAPRPIAFASTISDDGVPNLAPFSFFNCFSSNPPILVFSANRRVVDNTTKHTLHNVKTQGEVVINVVPYSMVRQMAVCSVEWPEGVSEFDQAGLHAIKSDLVKPFRVAESPVQFECTVMDIIELGTHGGAGYLILCKVVRMHISEDVIDETNRIDPHKIDLMGRMGRAYYTRASGASIETIVQPVTRAAIGFPSLPATAQNSSVLTGNQLGILSGMEKKPSDDMVGACASDNEVKSIVDNSSDRIADLHAMSARLIDAGEVQKAAAIIWYADHLS